MTEAGEVSQTPETKIEHQIGFPKTTDSLEADEVMFFFDVIEHQRLQRMERRLARKRQERREVLDKIEPMLPEKSFWMKTQLGSLKDMDRRQRAEVATCYTELGPKVAKIFQSEEFQGIVTDSRIREKLLNSAFLTPLVKTTNALIFGDLEYEEIKEPLQILRGNMERFIKGWENPEFTQRETEPLKFKNFKDYWEYAEELEQLMTRLPRRLTGGAHTVQFHNRIPSEFETHALLGVTPAATYHGGEASFFPRFRERYRDAYYFFLHEVVGHGNDISAGVYPVLPLRRHLEYFDRWTKLVEEDPTVITMNVFNAPGVLRQTQEDWADSLSWFLANPKALKRASEKRFDFFGDYVSEVSPDFDVEQYARETSEILERIEPRTLVGKAKKFMRERRKNE